MRVLFRLAFLLLSLLAARADMIIVPTDVATIQAAINAAAEHDTVLVEPGTYEESVAFGGTNLVLASRYLLTGDTTFIETTIIRAVGSSSVISINSSEDSTTVICGFTITVGLTWEGGGIRCEDASPVIRNNLIENNVADSGGGIYCANSRARILHNVIRDNNFYSPIGNPGGGICCVDGSDAEIGFNRISGNANQDGGGIACVNSSPWIHHNVIVDNIAMDLGGGIRCDNSDPLIENNVFAYNEATTSGGAMFLNLGSSPIVRNCILWGNEASGNPNQIVPGSGSPVFSYCDVQGGWPGVGMIQSDPLFRDASADDYRLSYVFCGDSEDSPCIDAGDPALIDSFDGCWFGLGWSICDIGAYGGAGDSVGSGICIPELPVNSDLCYAFPNPFNATTTIAFSLDKSSEVTLKIFDLHGRLVLDRTLGEMPAGTHRHLLAGDAFPSGVYFAQLLTAERIFVTRLALLK